MGAWSAALAVVGRVDADGNMFNEHIEEKQTSARVYDNSNVRFVSRTLLWDGGPPPVFLHWSSI